MSGPRLLDAGETALVVEFGDRIDEAIAARVIALDRELSRDPAAGVRELVPTYRSLMIHYDPLAIGRDEVARLVDRALQDEGAAQGPGRHWRIPACYDPALGEDLAHVAASTGLTTGQVVALHSGARYRVVMYGFAPGWAYMSGLPAALSLPRRASPRDRIPAGSLIVAGGQAIVASGAMPSGWHILGRTAERLFAPHRDPAFLLEVGDSLSFEAVDLATHESLSARSAEGEVVARPVPAG
jgi:KipI family sensor histidine kinase inhibitor